MPSGEYEDANRVRWTFTVNSSRGDQRLSIFGYIMWHTSKPGPDSKKIRTREKPGLEKNPDSCLTKPGLDF